MEIESAYSLLAHNSFGFDVQCQYYATPTSLVDLQELIAQISCLAVPRLVIGGGSNILFLEDYQGIVIRPQMQTIDIKEETADDVLLRVGAGMNWDQFVAYCVAQNWGGVENLSAIPGNVGAAPVQNIGAYGVEAKDTIVKVDGIDLESGEKRSFDQASCLFAYRDSIFKNTLKDQFLITYVWFRLSKKIQFNTSYGTIQTELDSIPNYRLVDVRNVICKIRTQKLPDPKEIGNAGSFFKNPIVDNHLATQLKLQYPTMPIYPAGEQSKLAAGWLIEQCGFKGIRRGQVGVHPHQALVLVHYGGGRPQDIVDLSNEIITSVNTRFGVMLVPEVQFVSNA